MKENSKNLLVWFALATSVVPVHSHACYVMCQAFKDSHNKITVYGRPWVIDHPFSGAVLEVYNNNDGPVEYWGSSRNNGDVTTFESSDLQGIKLAVDCKNGENSKN